MKKIIIILAVLFCFTGCINSNKSNKYTKTVEIDFEKYSEMISNKESFVLLMWQTGCSHCESFEPKLIDVIKKYDIKIYSINLANLSEVEYAKVKNKTFINGTPTTIYIKKGTTQANKLIGDKTEENIIQFLKSIKYIKE